MKLQPAAKSLIFLVLGHIAFVSTLYAISLQVYSSQGLYHWLAVVFLLIISLNLYAFASLFLVSVKTYDLMALVPALAVLIFFPSHWLQSLTALGVFIGLAAMRASIAKEERERLHFSYYRSVRRGLMSLLGALIFLAAINVYIATEQSLARSPEKFYENMAEKAVLSLRPVLKARIEGFSSDMTLDSFLGGESFAIIAPFVEKDGEVKTSLETPEEIEEVREALLKELRIEASGQDQVMGVLTLVMEERIKEVPAPVERFIPLIYALIIFLSLRILVPVLTWLIGGFGMLLFHLSVRSGLVKIIKKNVEVEAPVLI